MSAGMAEVIAAHWLADANDNIGWPGWTCGCDEYGTATEYVAAHATHVAEELAKAGYGKLAPHGVD